MVVSELCEHLSNGRRLVQKLSEFKVVNVVASTKLDKEIDIEGLSTHLKTVMYDPSIWAGMVWKRENPKSTIIMFSTGKVTCVGAKSEKEAKIGIVNAIQAIPELSDSHYAEPVIENIVAVADLGRRLDIEKLAATLGTGNYERGKFPGLIHKAKGVTFRLFRSGKILSTGGKDEKQLPEAMRYIIVIVESSNKKH